MEVIIMALAALFFWLVNQLPHLVLFGLTIYSVRVSQGNDGMLEWKEWERALWFVLVSYLIISNTALQTEAVVFTLIGAVVGERLGEKIIDNANNIRNSLTGNGKLLPEDDKPGPHEDA